MKRRINKGIKFIIEYNTALIFLVMLVVSAFASEAFFTPSNLFNLFRQVTPVGIISMGMLLVILTGGIDLSVGSVVAMVGVLCALFSQMMPLPMALIAALISGIAVGSLSGYLVAYHRMAPFIATLALRNSKSCMGPVDCLCHHRSPSEIQRIWEDCNCYRKQ